jgi:hypothetical protein
MSTLRKRKKPQTDLTPKAVKGKEADRVKGGFSTMLATLLKDLHDVRSAIIRNTRA